MHRVHPPIDILPKFDGDVGCTLCTNLSQPGNSILSHGTIRAVHGVHPTLRQASRVGFLFGWWLGLFRQFQFAPVEGFDVFGEDPPAVLGDPEKGDAGDKAAVARAGMGGLALKAN